MNVKSTAKIFFMHLYDNFKNFRINTFIRTFESAPNKIKN